MTSDTVTIYHDYDYGGVSQKLSVGAYTHADPGVTNAISAVKIPEGMVVTLWSKHDFTGEKLVLKNSTPRLTTFNDKAQSLLVAFDEPGFASSLHFAGSGRKINFAKNGFPLDYHSIAGERMQHLQDMLRLPDANGKQYYMGTYSQNVSATEGGMVFVGELDSAGNAKIIWCDVFSNRHRAGGYNHPGDLRRLGNVVVIAGQNWASGLDAAKDAVSAAKDFDLIRAGKKLGSFLGQSVNEKGLGETFNLGKGNFQDILFYDVSSPAAPEYMGKMHSCVDANNVTHSLPGEIDKVSVVKADDYYYLSFGRGNNGLICRSRELRPDVRWELVQKGSDESVSPATFILNGEKVVGRARLDDATKGL